MAESKTLPNVAIVNETSKVVKDVVSDIHSLLKSQARKIHPDNIVSKLSGDNAIAMKSYDFIKSITLGTGKDIVDVMKMIGNKEVTEGDKNTDKITEAVESSAGKTQDDLKTQTEKFSIFYEKQEEFLKNIKESVGDIHNIIYAMLRRNRNERLAQLEEEREKRRLDAANHDNLLDALGKLKGNLAAKTNEGEASLDTHGFLGTFLGNLAGKFFKGGLIAKFGKGLLTAFGVGLNAPGFLKSMTGWVMRFPKMLFGPLFSGLAKGGVLFGALTKGALGLLKFAAIWGTVILGIIDGIMEGIKSGLAEYKKSGSIIRAVIKGLEGFFGGLIEFLSFGLISKKEVMKVLDSIGGLVESLHIPKLLEGLYSSLRDRFVKEFNKLEDSLENVLGFNFEDIYRGIKKIPDKILNFLLIKFPEKMIKIVFGALDAAGSKAKVIGKILDGIYDFFEKIFDAIIDEVRSTSLGKLILNPFMSDTAEANSDKRIANKTAAGPTTDQIAKAKADLTQENEVVNTMVQKYGTNPTSPLARQRLDREIKKLQMLKDNYNRMIAPRVTPPVNPASENKVKAHDEGRKNLQNQTENLARPKPVAPTIVNAPTSTVVNNNTSAVIGTPTQDNDSTIQRMLGRSYGLLVPGF